MECPLCEVKMVVTHSRYLEDSQSTWRRHECVKCGERFTSTEKLIDCQVQQAIKRREEGLANAN